MTRRTRSTSKRHRSTSSDLVEIQPDPDAAKWHPEVIVISDSDSESDAEGNGSEAVYRGRRVGSPQRDVKPRLDEAGDEDEEDEDDEEGEAEAEDDEDEVNGANEGDELPEDAGEGWGAAEYPKIQERRMIDLFRIIKDPNVDLNPPYQREVVWKHPRMQRLILSIFQNYFIPPIVFAFSRDDEGKRVNNCLDGKQRCSSILQFMNGSFPVIHPTNGQKFYYRPPPGSTTHSSMKYTLLPAEDKALFNSRTVPLVQYMKLDDKKQRECFQRVQLGEALMTAEKLKAIAGPMSDFINKMVCKHLSVNAAGNMKVNQARSRSFQNVASYVMQQREHALPTNTQLHNWLSNPATLAPTRAAAARVDTVLETFNAIARAYPEEGGFKRREKVAPVEFWTICCLIDGIIGGRTYPGEVKNRTDVMRYALDWIARIPIVPPADPDANDEQEEEEVEIDLKPTSNTPRARRRERVIRSEDSDGDDQDKPDDHDEREDEHEGEDQVEQRDIKPFLRNGATTTPRTNGIGTGTMNGAATVPRASGSGSGIGTNGDETPTRRASKRRRLSE